MNSLASRAFLLLFFGSLLAISFSSASPSRKEGASISCYVCNSRNGTNSDCHDPFNPATINFTEQCKVPKQNHIGVFPARFCVKVIGRILETGEELVVRACSLENMDNQCGTFKFEKEKLEGCILTCDYDGCNKISQLNANINILLLVIIVFMFLI